MGGGGKKGTVPSAFCVINHKVCVWGDPQVTETSSEVKRFFPEPGSGGARGAAPTPSWPEPTRSREAGATAPQRRGRGLGGPFPPCFDVSVPRKEGKG